MCVVTLSFVWIVLPHVFVAINFANTYPEVSWGSENHVQKDSGAPENTSGVGSGVLGGAWNPAWAPGGTQLRLILILQCPWGPILEAAGVLFVFQVHCCARNNHGRLPVPGAFADATHMGEGKRRW